MKNNQPEKPSDQNHDLAQWAQYVDQRNRPSASGDSDGDTRSGTDSVEQFDLDSDLLDDLELDGQLRILGKISVPDDPFVDAVIAKTSSQSNRTASDLPRLPVMKPASVSYTVEHSQEATDEPSENDLSDSTTAVLSEATEQRKSGAFFAALVATLLIGCFLGSMWWAGSPAKISGPTVPDTSIAKTEQPESAPDSSTDSRQDDLEILPLDDTHTRPFSENEALVEQSTGGDSRSSSMPALNDNLKEEDWKRIIKETDKPHLKPSLVEIDKGIEQTLEFADSGLPALGDAKDLANEKVEVSSADGPIWDSKLDWNLELNFHDDGVGSFSLNGDPLQSILLQDNAIFLLRGIASELRRRVQFMENRLGAKVNGSISVDGTKFRFDRISELDETLKSVDQHLATRNIRTPTLEELMIIRNGYRKGIIANLNRFNSIDLAGKNLSLYTEDEAFTICSVLSSSEALLRDLATERLNWEKKKEIQSTETKRAITIAPKDFLLFAKSGVLRLPNPNFADPSRLNIQNLGPSALMQLLVNAPSVELFRNQQEFQEAKDFVYANGPADMQLRLEIDKMDRKLEDPTWSDEMRGHFNEQKSRFTRDLRKVQRRMGRSNGDDIAMQPLKDVLAKRTDLHGLPLTMGAQCQSGIDETRDLGLVSASVGKTIGRFNGSLGSRDAAQNDAFRNLFIKQIVSDCMKHHEAHPTSQKVKTINQILQIDHPRLRLEMIEGLRKSGTDAAIEVLVDKAKFDLEPEVRNAAIEALANVEPIKIRGTLLAGLNYPWHVVAEHSAEALVRLNDQGAIPNLIDMLDLPHPQFPTESNGELVQRELVGINHMRNCLLCHAPSINQSDSVRGLIPHQSRPLPRHYYDTLGSAFDVPFAVRADITYLEQDFSVVLPVEKPGPWPREQRFDFVVQKKKLTPVEAEQLAREINQTPNRNRNAVIFALRELTGEKPVDNSSDNWRNMMAARQDNGK